MSEEIVEMHPINKVVKALRNMRNDRLDTITECVKESRLISGLTEIIGSSMFRHKFPEMSDLQIRDVMEEYDFNIEEFLSNFLPDVEPYEYENDS